jgi:hypothetical protein
MPDRPDIWLVMHDEQPVAELAVERVDPRWLHGAVSRRERSDVLAPLFTRETLLAATTIGTTPRWWEAYREVRQRIRLIRPGGHELPEFILHIEGRRASWRRIEPITEPHLEATQ